MGLLLFVVATYAGPASAQSYNPKSNETLYFALEDTEQIQDPVGSLTVLCDGSRWTLGTVTTNLSRVRLGCDPMHQTTPVQMPGHVGTFYYYDCTQVVVNGETQYDCVLRVY